MLLTCELESHLDNNPLNCHISNLKWGTYSENNAQAIKDGLNTIPKPDNRKLYTIYNSNNVISFDCLGVNAIIDLISFGNDSRIRNYIFRQTQIPIGIFKGWQIKLQKTFRDQLLTEAGISLNVEPQANGGRKILASENSEDDKWSDHVL